MEEEPHVERLADRAELLHQRVIEAGEVIVVSDATIGAASVTVHRLDRVARELAPLDPDLGKDIERVLDELASRSPEIRLDERVVDFVQGAGKLLAVAAAPLLAADQDGRSRGG